ncbi:ankyrin [Anaeromyces robustus]|uniref:Ankyrin n=1 Tax=Anaeromyces robustus TaxID=1754192 RepID=A0A1Y1X3W2_9FUNG|nr:ankyrin [Anaeromyces robustus]|eukprot:ORX80483.1 ankyrin [Anaeromyces robustus]
MIFNNKNKLNKNLSYDEIKDFFNVHEKSQIESKQWDYYKKILYSLIKRKAQFNIVKLLIEQQHYDNTDLFFHAMLYKNYKAAELLLLYGADIENNSYYYKRNIVRYLYYDKFRLNLNQVSFLLNKTIKDSIKFGKIYDGLYEENQLNILYELNNIEIFRKLIFEMKKIEVFYGLIINNKLKSIQRLLYKNDYNQYFVKRILLIYKNGTSLSKTELKNLINDCKSYYKINDNDYCSILLNAMKYSNLEIVKFLIDYAKKSNIMLNKVYENLLTYTHKNYNLDKIKLILDYAKDYNITYKISNSVLFKYIDMYSRGEREPFIFLINYAKENNIILPIHEKDSCGNFIILHVINCNNYYFSYKKLLTLIQVIFEYAKKNNIILRLNDTNSYGNYLLLEATNENNGANLIQLLFDYAKENNIILSLNKKNLYGDYPLLKAVENNGIIGVKLIIEYAKENNITLQLNDTNNYGDYPLLCASKKNNNTNLIQLLFSYAKENNIILSLNRKNRNGDYPLLNAFCHNDQQLIQWLLQYAHEHNIHLEIDQNILINEKYNNEDQQTTFKKFKLLMKQVREYTIVLTINNDLLWYALKNNLYEFVSLLIDYAKENHMTLKLNEKFENNDYPLLQAVKNNNVELVKLLMNYARENNFILEINDKNLDNHYPLSCATTINNIEIVKLLIDYAKENNIVLNTNLNLGALDTGNINIVKELIAYTKNDKKAIKSFYNGNYPLICAIKNDDIETVKNLLKYGKVNNINLRKLFRNIYPLICAIKNSNLEMVKLLLNTSRKIKYTININDKNVYQIRKSNNNETQKKN